MILTGREIQAQQELGRIKIEPFDEKQVNPNSYNLKLHNELQMYKHRTLDMKKDNAFGTTIKIPDRGYYLLPGILYLARTVEYTETDYYVPMLEGRSSIGRLGLSIHVTAGFGDVGFKGYWTLEMSVIQPLYIYPNVEICQIYYHEVEGGIKLYDSGKYQSNNGIQRSLLFRDFI